MTSLLKIPLPCYSGAICRVSMNTMLGTGYPKTTAGLLPIPEVLNLRVWWERGKKIKTQCGNYMGMYFCCSMYLMIGHSLLPPLSCPEGFKLPEGRYLYALYPCTVPGTEQVLSTCLQSAVSNGGLGKPLRVSSLQRQVAFLLALCMLEVSVHLCKIG